MTDLPKIALSVRQPWAWAIIHAGKDIENRAWPLFCNAANRRGRVAIHASEGITRQEYHAAAEAMGAIGVTCPALADLERGGIIGSVNIVDTVTCHASPWFAGPTGLVLANPVPHPFVRAAGALGFFRWAAGGSGDTPEPPAGCFRARSSSRTAASAR